MKKLFLVLFLFTMAVIATQTNPSKDDYINAAVENLRGSSNDAIEVGVIQLFGDNLIKSTTTSKDYILFSVYETTIYDNSVKVLGVFNNFIGLSNIREGFPK